MEARTRRVPEMTSHDEQTTVTLMNGEKHLLIAALHSVLEERDDRQVIVLQELLYALTHTK